MTRTTRTMMTLTLLLSAAGFALADDSRLTARPIGTDRNTISFVDRVGNGDFIDYYTFQLSETRAVQAQVSGLAFDANLHLMTTSGHVIKTGHTRGLGTTAVREDLKAGTYFLAVYTQERSKVSGYTLKFSSWIPVTGGQTRNLGALDGMGGFNGTRSASGTITPRDGWIDYWFSLPDTRQIKINVSAPAGAGLFNDKQQFQQLVHTGPVNRTLPAGRHFIRVFRDTYKNIAFSLTVTASVPDTRDSAGNVPSRARNLGTAGNNVITLDEYVGRYDFDDYYRIWVQAGVTLNLQLSQRGENANLWLYNQTGRELARSVRLGRASEAISYNIRSAGSYLIRVGIATRNGPYWEHSSYKLNVGLYPAVSPTNPIPAPVQTPTYRPPQDKGGNTPLLAQNLFTLVGNGQPLTDAIGGFDREDYYAFTLLKNGFNNIRGTTITLTGLRRNANLVLYRRLGDGSLRQLASSTNQGTANERLDVNLPAYDVNGYQQRYVLRVTTSSAVGTPYTLTTTVR